MIDATTSGYFITDGNDIESYSILPYDDNPKFGWYIMTGDGYEEPIDKIIVNQFKILFKVFGQNNKKPGDLPGFFFHYYI